MTKEARNPNPKASRPGRRSAAHVSKFTLRISSFGFLSSFVIRHSDFLFVLRHSSFLSVSQRAQQFAQFLFRILALAERLGGFVQQQHAQTAAQPQDPGFYRALADAESRGHVPITFSG